MASGAADETAATATAVITTQAKASQKQKTDKIRKSPGVQYPKVTSSPGVNFIVMKREAVKRTNMGGSPSTAQPPSQNQISSPTLQDLSPDTRAAISQASKRKPRKLLSEIWTEAEPIYKEGKLVEGKRVHCHQIFAASRQSGTSYMKRHLKGSSQVMGGEAAPSLQGLVDSPLRRTSCHSSSTSRLASTMTVPSKRKAAFELKHSLLQALNKIADRDTYHIGLSELEKAVHALSPDMVRPFLSCVIHTDADQKSAVRKECIKVIATLARCHGSLLAPHMTKVVTSVVKRLKGADSVVMDACVDTCATLSVCARNYGDDGGAVLVALVRPLLESLVKEPNKYVQAGAALCLAKVIDESSSYFPGPLLPRMLARVVKILNNTHFIAKPAVIELITSIVQAEGASTEQALSSALTSIMDSLKSSDWTTRKAASVALSSIAVSSGYLVAPFTTSCLRSLERCKFDKVKPVRVAITHAIQLWKAIPGSDTREPSEAGSSTKENFFGDHHDAPSAGLADWILPLLPNDLLVEILLRLPVKPLHRFKCVSKSCRDLVSCHRKRFPQALAGLFYYHYNWPPEWGRANTLQFINFLARGPPPVDPALAFLPNHASFSVEDCCNGLLLLFSSYGQPRDYLVCNPATKKRVALPNSGVAGPRWHSVLAFDPDVSVHFHVVEYVDQDPNSAVGIYSSRTGGWSHTVLRGTRLYHYSGNPDCEQSWTPIVNGMLHFPCDTEVMSIDLETKEWRHIQLPLAEGDCCDFFGQSDGCLVYVCSDEDAQSFWTLKDYESGAWSLKHRASHTESGPSSEILGGAFHPHCSILFYPGQEGWLMSYDFDRGELRRIAGTDDFHGYSPFPYVPYFGDFGV